MTNLEGNTIDPTWWECLLHTEDDDLTFAGWVTPELASTELRRAADACVDAESMQALTLAAMARATSAMLRPDNPGEPFHPAMTWDGRRSELPCDLDDTQLALLTRVAPMVTNPLVRARLADSIWTYGATRDRNILLVAVDAYLEIPLDSSTWQSVGRDAWRRAIGLLRSQGRAHAPRIAEIRQMILDRLLAPELGDGWVVVELSDLLREQGRVDSEDAAAIAAALRLQSVAASNGHRLTRHLLRGARSWSQRAGDNRGALGCTVAIADTYEAEGAARLGGGEGQGMASGRYFEKAIQTLVGLPRAYRLENQVDERVGLLRARLRESREVTLESMVAFETEPLDITDYVETAQRQVTGRGQFDALVQLAGMLPLTDADQAFSQARAGIEQHPLSRLFPGETFSVDGRKVAASGGGLGEPSDTEVWHAVVRDFGIRSSLMVQACIGPARDVLVSEHNVLLNDLERLCSESPVVHPDHVHLWARGLWHGLHGDFPSAVALLVPQTEQFVRQLLKSNGMHTLTVDELTGVESEKGLGALLAMDQTKDVLGAGLRLELRALLVEQAGANLRNEVAHGLLTDSASWSRGAIYIWWLCLRIVVLPVWTMRQPTPPTQT